MTDSNFMEFKVIGEPVAVKTVTYKVPTHEEWVKGVESVKAGTFHRENNKVREFSVRIGTGEPYDIGLMHFSGEVHPLTGIFVNSPEKAREIAENYLKYNSPSLHVIEVVEGHL